MMYRGSKPKSKSFNKDQKKMKKNTLKQKTQDEAALTGASPEI